MPGVSTPEGQCNPAPVHTALTGTQQCVLESLVPHGKSQVLCSLFITRGGQNLPEGFSKDPLLLLLPKLVCFVGMGRALNPFLPQRAQSSRNCIQHRVGAPEISPPSHLSFQVPEHQGQRYKAPWNGPDSDAQDTEDHMLKAKAWSERGIRMSLVHQKGLIQTPTTPSVCPT